MPIAQIVTRGAISHPATLLSLLVGCWGSVRALLGWRQGHQEGTWATMPGASRRWRRLIRRIMRNPGPDSINVNNQGWFENRSGNVKGLIAWSRAGAQATTILGLAGSIPCPPDRFACLFVIITPPGGNIIPILDLKSSRNIDPVLIIQA